MRQGRSLVAVAIVMLSLLAKPSAQTDETARDIIQRVDRILRGDASRGVATMEVVTKQWERRLTMEMWSLGSRHSLVRVLSPTREAGTATLTGRD